ncbi:MAG: bifunctional protein FolC [Armatimonadetes bacterium JP3_11]|nr:MAG: bifunctional protein FolC [Armatimonadetes bacterium CP1_7O]OYT75585.1 MAG: bifunctional protein FolC [Armatimonadetes bacterium JP3_11]RMH10761.1 MAG: bifunctional folylpolyglutamate synthase/dihydrofolate synthase [Armatimonadota bacterium]
MSFTQAVRYVQSLSIQGWRLGNARFEAFLERLGNPHLEIPCVHITGTNGKGSTTTLVSSILRAAGYRVGTYISPHVFDIRERILLNGELISEELFTEGVAMMRPIIERLSDTEYGQITEFEIKTALAFWAFRQAQVDIAVLEVGLGGRMDATNVITPEVSVIVSIGLDHTDRLGPTHRDIAYEKAGIIKPGRPVVSGALHPDAAAMIAQVAAARHASLYPVLPDETDIPLGATQPFFYSSLPSPTDSAVRVRHGEWEIALQPYLIGDYQRHNTACAVATAVLLRERGYSISDEAIERGVREARLPGRLQIVAESPRVVLDGAHNPDAAAALAKALPRLFKYRRLILVFGMLTPHEPQDTLQHLLPLADVVVFTTIPNPRAHTAQDLLQSAQQWLEANPRRTMPTLFATENPQQAFEQARAIADVDDLILVTGSFYLVGEWKTSKKGQSVPQKVQ